MTASPLPSSPPPSFTVWIADKHPAPQLHLSIWRAQPSTLLHVGRVPVLFPPHNICLVPLQPCCIHARSRLLPVSTQPLPCGRTARLPVSCPTAYSAPTLPMMVFCAIVHSSQAAEIPDTRFHFLFICLTLAPGTQQDHVLVFYCRLGK